MSAPTRYRVDYAGDWGAPPEGGSYSTGTLPLPDGVKLFYRSWLQPDASAPVLVLLHGLGAHGGWFIDMGNELHGRGLSVYVPDHRGFGRSEGPRGHTLRWQTYPADVTHALDELERRHPGAPLFLLGHSMGAIFTIHVAAAEARQKRTRLGGILLMNPWIRDTTRLSLRTQAGIAWGGMRGSARVINFPFDMTSMTPNAEAGQMLDADPYWVRAQSAAFLYQIGLQMRNTVLKRAREVRAPALVLQGDGDKIVVQAASKECYERLGSKDKTYKTYPGFCHDCEFEPQRAALDDDIAAWVRAHASSAPGAGPTGPSGAS